jgi:hypothetical protein
MVFLQFGFMTFKQYGDTIALIEFLGDEGKLVGDLEETGFGVADLQNVGGQVTDGTGHESGILQHGEGTTGCPDVPAVYLHKVGREVVVGF